MRVLGYDPSSSSAGIALTLNGEPEKLVIWKPENKKDKPLNRLVEWSAWFEKFLYSNKPIDMMAIEIIAFAQSHQVTRILSRYESVAIVEAKKQKIMVIEHRVSEARQIVFGSGKLDKESAYKEMKQRYPHLPWLNFKSGGGDQSDSLAIALAAPSLAER